MTKGPPTIIRRAFQSFEEPNFRLFFLGQTISTVGTHMQRVAQDWLILDLGGGPLELAMGVGLQSVPALFLSMWGGLLADRVNLRRLLIATQAVFAALSIVLGTLVLTGHATILIVYVFAFFLGCTNVVDKPARQTFVLDMVRRESVANAVSMNSSMNNAARLVGPAIAGLLIAATGSGIVFLINAATFAAIIVQLLRMNVPVLAHRKLAERQRGQVREGLRYSVSDPNLRAILIATLITSTLAQNFRVLLPLFVTDVLGLGAGAYGALMSALGAGALGGAMLCAFLLRPTHRIVAWTLAGFSFALLTAAFAPTYALLFVVMLGVGAGNTSFNTASQSVALLHADADKRGRVMAIRQLASNAIAPLGALFTGWVCAVASPRAGFGVSALAAAIATVVMMFFVRSGRRGADARNRDRRRPTSA